MKGIKVYPESQLYKEMAFIAYYFHWGIGEIMNLPHRDRRTWCSEISTINSQLNNAPKNIFEGF